MDRKQCQYCDGWYSSTREKHLAVCRVFKIQALEQENTQLRELLKEVEEYFKWEDEQGWFDCFNETRDDIRKKIEDGTKKSD